MMLESNLTKITDKLDMSDSERCANQADHRKKIKLLKFLKPSHVAIPGIESGNKCRF